MPINNRDVSCQLSDVSDIPAALSKKRRKRENADAYGPCASLFARMSQPIRNPYPCSAFRPIPVGISRSLEAQFNSPLNPLRFIHSHSLVVHTCYICTSATMMSGCRKQCFDSRDGGFLQTAEGSRKNRFSNGRIREDHSALTDACILHLQLATPCTRALVVFRLFVIYHCHGVVRPRSS